MGAAAVGCASPTDQRLGREGATAAAPRTLHIGLLATQEPSAGITGGQAAVGRPEHTYLLHAGLTVYDGQGQLLPRIARQVPSADGGDWRVFPGGEMEVTWRLRPDVFWHDGVPLTASDFVFGLPVVRDSELPFGFIRPSGLISEVLATDDRTLVVRWKAPYAFASDGGMANMPALPQHLLSELYPSNKQAFVNSRYWTEQFVGLGPYRMGGWVFGSSMEVIAFDQYFLGRPRTDRVIINYFANTNGLVASLLSGDTDVAPVGSLKTEEAVTLRNAWAPTGAGTIVLVPTGTRHLRFQDRDAAAPWTQDPRVRQALSHLVDRQALVEALLFGLTEPAATLVPPDDPVYRLLDRRGLTTYAYDPGQAQRLLGAAGWLRGSDGAYRSASGEPFTIAVSSSNNVNFVPEIQAVAAQWKEAGLNATPYVFSDTASNASELKNTFPGVQPRPWIYTPVDPLRGLLSSEIGNEGNHWAGSNFGGYVNPRVDMLNARYLVTAQLGERQALLADALKIVADDAVIIPAYYDIFTAAVRAGVRGPGSVQPIQPINAWNAHEWEVD